MLYYAYYQDGVLIGLNATVGPVGSSAVEITKEVFVSLGGVDPEPAQTIDTIRAAKLSNLSAAGNAAIVAGVAVTLPSTDATEHFSLHETDQINLSTAMVAVEQGASGYPYHADGQLCHLYPTADILAISDAAIRHKLYHTTYCNHLLVWARRAETVEELEGITYGAELPTDLAANLAAVLAAAGGGVDA